MELIDYDEFMKEVAPEWNENPFFSDMRIICAPARDGIENIDEIEKNINYDIYEIFGGYIGEPEDPQPDWHDDTLGEWAFTTEWDGTDRNKIFQAFSKKYPDFAFGLILEPMTEPDDEAMPSKDVWYNGGEHYTDDVYYDEYFNYSLPMI